MIETLSSYLLGFARSDFVVNGVLTLVPPG